ncbi:MAG: dihydroorotase [Acidobacteria bacterium]|nr:dihydroorotase [Candidatus Sulfomarinibacter kjeldsenii]
MQLQIAVPDDWHLHLRDGGAMRDVVVHSARRFGRAVIMPNLQPPITTVAEARAYRRRIVDALPENAAFEPLMTLYLTDLTPPDEIAAASVDDAIVGVKLYPAGATTNSEAGVTDLDLVMPTLEAMSDHGLPLLVHGEVTDPAVDIFDREKVFIERVLAPLVERVPGLNVVFEHITTADAVAWVLQAPSRVAATITPHHLMLDRNAIFGGGIHPHLYCLPVLKRDTHQNALVWAVTSGNPRFFLGTDSAPHPKNAKECANGCAGIFSAHAAIELYVEVFEDADALDLLEGFASHHGADFYGLARNEGEVVLVREEWAVPMTYAFGDHEVVPLRAGETVRWRVADRTIPG